MEVQKVKVTRAEDVFHRCPFQFGGPECAYKGPCTSCLRTIRQCTALGHQARFGGVLFATGGYTPSGVYVDEAPDCAWSEEFEKHYKVARKKWKCYSFVANNAVERLKRGPNVWRG